MVNIWLICTLRLDHVFVTPDCQGLWQGHGWDLFGSLACGQGTRHLLPECPWHHGQVTWWFTKEQMVIYIMVYIYIVSPLVYSIIPFIIPYIYQTMLISWDYTYIIIYIYLQYLSHGTTVDDLGWLSHVKESQIVGNPMGGHHVGGPDPGGNWQGFKHQTYWWCELTNALPLFTPNIKIWNISPEAIV